jgi:hypothetical protein
MVLTFNHSLPLSQLAISHGNIYFYMAGYELFGSGHGHLATLKAQCGQCIEVLDDFITFP